MHKILKNYPFSLLIAIVIWIVCMIPIPETPLSEISFIDKWTHFVMYAILTLSMLSERHRQATLTLRSSLLICAIAALMGCCIELAQKYLTSCRSGDWFDALCNALGSVLGLIFFTLFLMLYQKKR